MKKIGTVFFGTMFVFLAVSSCFSAVSSAVGHSTGRGTGILGKLADVPYGILIGPFDQTFGALFFFIYFFGGQAVIAGFIGFLGFQLMKMRNHARVTLLYFSTFNFVLFAFQLGPVIRKAAAQEPWNAISLAIVIGVFFYAGFIIYFTRERVKSIYRTQMRGSI
jgi:hypothetical protein